MNILLRSIVTGLGLKLGSELGKFISEKVKELTGSDDDADSPDGESPDDDLPGTSPEPPAV